MPNLKFSPKQIADLIRQACGNLSIVAEKMGCERNTVARYVKRFDICARAMEEGKLRMVEIAESELMSLIKLKNFHAIRLCLISHGKSKGWVDRSDEQTAPAGAGACPLIVRVLGPDGRPLQLSGASAEALARQNMEQRKRNGHTTPKVGTPAEADA